MNAQQDSQIPDLTIRRGNPTEPGATRLLENSRKLMDSLFPQEENEYLTIEALDADYIHFFVAESGGEIIGCAALADMREYGEIKSMFVDSGARGAGLAVRLLERIEQEALALDLPVLKLETGDLQDGAHRLYARQGFDVCGPFGEYHDSPLSIFMEKSLH